MEKSNTEGSKGEAGARQGKEEKRSRRKGKAGKEEGNECTEETESSARRTEPNQGAEADNQVEPGCVEQGLAPPPLVQRVEHAVVGAAAALLFAHASWGLLVAPLPPPWVV